MNDIKIFESVFKPKSEISFNNIIFPVSAGAALYPDKVNTVFRDDTGENISEKNPDYCELTVHYWAWKNVKADFYGIVHQRRFFDFSNSKLYSADSGKIQRPYRIFDEPSEDVMKKTNNNIQAVSLLLEKYRVIAPMRENIFRSVTEYYDRSDRIEYDDIGLVSRIIDDICPEYSYAKNKYLNGCYSYFCNMFIMDRENFNDYSQWLFRILSEYEKRKPKEYRYPRECGKIAERLFGIWFTRLIEENIIPWAEIPRIHFSCISGTTSKNLSFNKTIYKFLPPGTRRRAFIWGIKNKTAR